MPTDPLVTMMARCRRCGSLQYVPIRVADGTDPWRCEECGREMNIPRRNLSVPKKNKQKETP